MFPARGAAIVGVYTTAQAKSLERSSYSLQLEAIKGALSDAGLTAADVNGVVPMGEPPDGRRWPQQFWAAQFGGRPLTYVQVGTPSPNIVNAALAISAGLADVVVVFSGKAGFRVGPRGTPVPKAAPRIYDWDFRVMGASFAQFYAMWARRYMHEFSVTSADLAEVAVRHRYHATLNPESVMGSRGEITIDDVLGSRMVSDPLHLLDCALDTDGGHALVLASSSVARDCKKAPVWVIGGAEAADTDFYMTIDVPWIRSEAGAVRRTGDIAFAQAGVTRSDIDVANLYDCFTVTMLRDLEELGFCGLGEGPSYFNEGHTGLGAAMPCNTDGGLLSGSHIGMIHGMQAIEVTRQLRGECGARQVQGARIGLVLAQGASVHGYAGTAILASD